MNLVCVAICLLQSCQRFLFCISSKMIVFKMLSFFCVISEWESKMCAANDLFEIFIGKNVCEHKEFKKLLDKPEHRTVML